MRGGGTSKPPADAGLPCDMKALLEAFQTKNSLRFVDFFDVAVDYGLKDIYGGRMSVATLIEFEESVLNAAFAYVRPRKEYENGLGETRTLKIRATPTDIYDLQQLATLLSLRCLEAYGFLHRLLSDHAFVLVSHVKKHDLSHHQQYERPNPAELLLDEEERYVPLEAVKEMIDDSAMKFAQQEMERKQKLIGNDMVVAETTNNFLDKATRIYSSLKYEFSKMDQHMYEDAALTKLHYPDLIDAQYKLVVQRSVPFEFSWLP
uniref:Bromo domain-containing protein n=1 Tax=Angiostrongylus cantonensis TaxID=6313 RepID=A0A0K0D914_ANGCA